MTKLTTVDITEEEKEPEFWESVKNKLSENEYAHIQNILRFQSKRMNQYRDALDKIRELVCFDGIVSFELLKADILEECNKF